MRGAELDVYLGRRLRQRRVMLGLTQKQLGDAAGIKFRQIHKYECAENRMTAERVWQLSVALDVSVGYFFEGLETSGLFLKYMGITDFGEAVSYG